MDTEAAMSIISDLRKVSAFVGDTIEIYETLEAKLGHEPDMKSAIIPLAYKHAVEYNRKNAVLDPVLMTMAGRYLSVRYRILQQYFADPEGVQELERLEQRAREFLEVQ